MIDQFTHLCLTGGRRRVVKLLSLFYFRSVKHSVGKIMILLEVHNRIIEELLTLQIEAFLRKEKLVDLKSDVVGK